MQTRSLTAALVKPNVYDQEDKNEKPSAQQDNGKRLILPNRMEVFRDLVEIHATPIYTLQAQSKTAGPILEFIVSFRRETRGGRDSPWRRPG